MVEMTPPRIPAETTTQGDRPFLAGPRSRKTEFMFTLRVLIEFIRGFRALHFVGPCVTFFGSARFQEGHEYYEFARKVAGGVSRLGFTIMTGGGPGIMEAANRGGMEAGGRSVGAAIELPKEQSGNRYMHRWMTFRYFFVRKFLLLKYSYAFVILPGGFRTMGERFETLRLIQTGKIQNFPVILMGIEYWQNVRNMLDEMVRVGTISASDLDLMCFTDSIDTAIQHIEKHALGRFGLHSILPIRILGERASA
jgi:uncharacterized protein (TIGR00730 family)